ncbi:PLDc N-terminal domain-containing protein [Ktedonobacter robiniae]|nr:PLD nuclease N-terminal domain-containing protein [Ktedonobacter robiniae]
MVLQDDHSALGMLGWLLLIWLIPFIGPLLYLLFGQRRSRVYFGQPSYVQNPYQQQR